MRISNKMLYDTAIQQMSSQLERVTQTRSQTASGKQYAYISENPTAASQSLTLKTTLQQTQSHLETAQAVNDWMAANELALNNLTELVKRALQIGTGALSETNGPSERMGVAIEIEGIVEQVLDTANAGHNSSYLFSGFSVTEKPFEISGATVVFNGDNGAIQHDLGGQVVTVNQPGQAIFSPLLEALMSLEGALRGNDTEDIGNALGDMLDAAETVSQARTLNGSRQRQAQLSVTNLEKTQVELKKMISEKEDIDMVEAITRLQQEENLFQTILEVEQRTISAMNLFDMLQ